MTARVARIPSSRDRAPDGAARSRKPGGLPSAALAPPLPWAAAPRAPSRHVSFVVNGVIESLERAQLRSVPDFDAGDRVRVHFQVVEGTRRRTQVFEGVVIKRQGSGARETFTVRKQSFGVGVERTFPVHSPKIEQIEVASRGDVRRAKLYYLRGRVGRRARVRERRDGGPASTRAARAAAARDANGSSQAAAEPPSTAESEPAAGEEQAPDPGVAAADESASRPA